MAPIVLDGGPPSDMKLLSVTLDRVPLQAGSDYKVLLPIATVPLSAVF